MDASNLDWRTTDPSTLMVRTEPCPKCGMSGADGVLHLCPDDYDREMALLDQLAKAAILMDDQGGLGVDKVREIARQIKRLREAR